LLVQYSPSIPFQRARWSSLKACGSVIVDVLILEPSCRTCGSGRRFQPSAQLGAWRKTGALEYRLAASQYNKIRNGLNPESRG
jgi:hypothetical protein